MNDSATKIIQILYIKTPYVDVIIFPFQYRHQKIDSPE